MVTMATTSSNNRVKALAEDRRGSFDSAGLCMVGVGGGCGKEDHMGGHFVYVQNVRNPELRKKRLVGPFFYFPVRCKIQQV